MTHVKDKSTLSQLSIAAVQTSHFRTSSTAGLAKKIKEGSSDAFRDMLADFEGQGVVPHDSSIISAAAYLADLLRMVDGKSQSPSYEGHTLKARRPDIWQIPLDAENTTKQSRYLLLANRAMGHHIGAGCDGDDTRRHRLHEISRTANHGFRYAEVRARRALAHAGHDLPDVLSTLRLDHESGLARMSMTGREFSDLGHAFHYRTAWQDAGLHTAVQNCHLTSPTAPDVTPQHNLKSLFRRIGITQDLLTGFCGYENRHSEFCYMIWHQVRQFLSDDFKKKIEDKTYWLEEDDGVPVLMWEMSTDVETAISSAANAVPLDATPETADFYFTILAELKRIATIADKTGWPIKDLIYLVNAYGWSNDGRIDFAHYGIIERFSDMRAFQTKHDLTLEEVAAIFIEPFKFVDSLPDNAPTWFQRTFAGQKQTDEQFSGALYLDHLQDWYARAHALDGATLKAILQMPDRVRIKAMPIETQGPTLAQMWQVATINSTTLFAPYRYKALAKAFDMPVSDILMLQFHMGLPFSSFADARALIAALDMVVASGSSVTEILSLSHVATTVIYPASTLLPMADLVATQMTPPIEPEGATPDSPFWSNQIEAVKHVIKDHFKVSFKVMNAVITASMTWEEQQAFFIPLMQQGFHFLKEGDPVEVNAGTIAFGNLLTALAFVKTFEIDVDMMSKFWDAPFFGIENDGLHGWRSVANISVWTKLRAFHKANDIKVVDMAKALETASFAHYDTQSDASKAAGDLPPMQAACFALMTEHTGLSTADLTPYWSSEPAPFAPDSDTLSYAQQLMGLCDMGKLSKATGSSLAQLKALGDFFSSHKVEGEGTPPEVWKDLNEITDAMMTGLETVLPPRLWNTLVEKTGIDILEAERDALCTTLLLDHYRTADLCQTEAQNKTLPQGIFPIRIEDRDALSAYLLLDVEMGGTAKISPVKLALNSVQQYIQRMISKKEDPALFTVDENQWTWRAHYRLWEANRKVFLFPENFLDPGLRRNKTPIFKELEEALLQTTIDDDTVSAALLTYLDKLQDLSELEVVSACAARMHQPGAIRSEKHIFFLGRAAGGGSQYYLRSCICHRHTDAFVRWTPWELIHLSAHAETMSVTVINNRVHLFWVEVQQVGQTPVGAGAKREKASYGTLKSSTKRLGAGWSEPRIVDGCEHFHLGSIAQQSNGSWKLAKKGKAITQRYPSDIPQANFKITGDIVDNTDPHSRHPRIMPNLEFEEDLCNALAALNPTLLPDLPSPAFWAFKAARSDAVWSTQEEIYARLPEDRITPTGEPDSKLIKLDPISLDLTLDRKHVFGAFHDPATKQHHVLRSYDGGKNWQNGLVNLIDAKTDKPVAGKDIDPRAIIIPSGAADTDVYLINGAPLNGIYHSKDSSTTWRGISLPKGMETFSSCGIGKDGKVIVVVGKCDAISANGMVSISLDGGENWAPVTTLPRSKHNAFNVVVDTQSRGICVELDGKYLVSGDLGKTWTGIPSSNAKGEHIGPDEGLVSGRRNEAICGFNWRYCYASFDGGQTFEKLGGETETNIVSVHLVGKKTFVRCTDGLYQFSGGRWVKQNLDIPKDPTKGLVMTQSFPRGNFLVGIEGVGLRYPRPVRAAKVLGGVRGNGSVRIGSPEVFSEFFATTAPDALGEILTSHGIDALMSLETQKRSFPTQRNATKHAGSMAFQPSDAFSQYYRELFFHIPYLIADTLNRHKKFEEAKRWYSFIFNPNLIGTTPFEGDEMPFWRFAPFRDYKLEDLQNCVDAEFDIYENDPFDAHAVAAIRLGAYERAVVMRYIDNLLNWGDDLFGRDNWESITEAMLYYTEALDLLGPDPSTRQGKDALPASRTVDAFLNDAALSTHADNSFHLEDRKVFPIPTNTYFDTYWVRVNDRLEKIRASENLKGMHRDLALFQAPVDPRKIMAAMAAGMPLALALNTAGQTGLRQRFSTLLRTARDFTGTVVQFGNSLMSALEKRDANGLENLRMTQAQNILDISTKIKEIGIANAQSKLEALRAEAADAKAKVTHFEKLHRDGLIGPEKDGLRLKNNMLGLQSTTAAIRLGSVPGYLTPNIFGLADGGSNIGRSVEMGAAALDATATAFSTSSGMAEQRGQNDRRAADWVWQKKQAKAEVDRIAIEIKVAKAAIEQATLAMSAHQADMDHHDELINYAKDRFTNQQLYALMAGKMSAVYRNGFNLAQEFAHDAERAHRFERGQTYENPPVIRQGALASLSGALASGQQLQLALGHLEKAHLTSLSREIEVEKTISLKTIGADPQFGIMCADWSTITTAGVLKFEITQAFLQNDQLGAGYRRIRSIGVTLPAIVGPYQNVNGVLYQVWHMSPEDQKQERTGSNAERIAISKGVKDFGTTLNASSSDHYLPFEFTGAVSGWRLELPKGANAEILESLSDVVIHLNYIVS